MIIPHNKSMTVKPFEAEDVSYLEAWIYDESYSDFFRDMLSLTKDQLKIYSYMKDGQAFMIRMDDDPKPIGFIVLYEFRAVSGNLKMAILIDKDHQKKGLCFEAMRAACEYAFFRMRYHKLIVEVVESNIELRRSCEKGGFALEAILHEETNVDGKFVNVARLVMFKQDYEKRVQEGFYGS